MSPRTARKLHLHLPWHLESGLTPREVWVVDLRGAQLMHVDRPLGEWLVAKANAPDPAAAR